jgi:hypothetical protein
MAAFDKRFAPSFRRVYAYVYQHTADRDVAERITRDVLASSLPALLDASDAELGPMLLRSAKQGVLAAGVQRSGPGSPG